ASKLRTREARQDKDGRSPLSPKVQGSTPCASTTVVLSAVSNRWGSQDLQHLFAVLAQLRISDTGHAKELRQGCGSRRRDRGERRVVEHHECWDSVGTGRLQAPLPQAFH